MLTRKLSVRFALVVIGMTLLFGVLFSFLQIYADYNNYRNSIIDGVKAHLQATADVASKTLYNIDELTAQSLVNGTVATNHIVSSTLIDEDGEVIAEASETRRADIWRPLNLPNYIEELIVQVEDEERTGKHRVEVDLELGLQEFYNRAIITFGVELIQSFIIALLVYFISLRLIAKPVENLSEEVSAIEPGVHPDKFGSMNRDDELGLLARNTYEYILKSHQFAEELEHRQKERLELEEKLRHSQKMDAIGQLAGGVAHDFNNIMTVVLGNLTLAQTYLEMGNMEKLDKSLNAIAESSERAAKLTKQLLVFSRKDLIEPAILDIRAIIEDSGNILARLIPESITIDYVLEDVWPIYTDSNQMELILINLVVNAKDAMTDGGNIIVESKNVKVNDTIAKRNPFARVGDYVMFSVTDTGTGISDGDLERVFEPFFTTKKVGKGTGLGLSTVYGIVNKWEGFILINTELGKGTCFQVYLPAASGEVVVHSKKTSSKTTKPDYQFEGRVLVCEDDDSVRNLLVELLRTTDFEITEAANPLDAIEYFKAAEEPFDLLITDIIMPDMNGRELAEYLSRSKPLKTVFVSGYSANIISEQGVVTDDITFVQKPFSRDKLFEAVHRVLNESP